MVKTNLNQEDGYGEDAYSREAVELIKKASGAPGADVHLLVGGTQTNLTAIGAFLRPHEGVIAPATGHINTHEAGAVEATGHKVLSVPSGDGKITPEGIREVLDLHGSDEHMVKPRLVYLSQSTELGTVYTRDELADLSELCRERNLLLYADGARLGPALVCGREVPDLAEMARLCDAFYIGGTKNGALAGEALVIGKDDLKADFRYHVKQRGGLLAKGRVLGLQFLVLFRDGLFYDLARHANRSARLLEEGIRRAGYGFLCDSPTNQIFPILPDRLIARLEREFGFYVWEPAGEDKSAIRLVTSWMTKKEELDRFIGML